MRLAIGALAAVVIALGVWGWVRSRWPADRADAGQARPAVQPANHPAAPSSAMTVPPPVLLPDRLAGLSAEPVLRVVYQSAPPASAGAGGPRPRVRFGILARREGQEAFAALRDGDPLSSERDGYILAARAMTAGWVYGFQVDAAGTVDWLFPKNDTSPYSTGANPLVAGQTAQVPAVDARQALTLDRTAGVEHVYFVFAAARWPDLGRALAVPPPPLPAVALRGGGDPDAAGPVTEPNGLGLRGGLRAVGGTQAVGAGGVSAGVEVLFHQGGVSKSVTGGADAEAAGPLVVVERWFRHIR